MITFLRRLFIKDYQNVNDENVRRAHGVFGAIFGIVTNILIAGLKVGAAIFLASKASWVFPVALIADAVNNISDIASSIVTLIGFKLADKPADKEHPFGHQRIEYIAGLFVAILILVAGYELLKESIESVIAFHSSGTHSSYDLLACIILGVSILLKFFQSLVNRGLGKAINSPTLLAVSLDSLMDCLTTSSVLLSAILMLTLGWNFMDGYIGILVSFLLIISGIKAVKETASPLIGEGVNKELEETIRGEVLAHKEIHGVHDFICHYYGVDKKFITLHAEIDQNTTLIEAHRIVDEIEDQLKAEYKADVTIHIDPTAIGDHEVARMELLVLHEVTMIDPRAKIHDFQMDKENKRIDFDVLAPFDSKLTEEALKKRLLENIAAFEFSFHIDHPMGD